MSTLAPVFRSKRGKANGHTHRLTRPIFEIATPPFAVKLGIFNSAKPKNALAGKRVAFEQLESQLYEELQNIVGESGVLHTALDRALKLEIEVRYTVETCPALRPPPSQPTHTIPLCASLYVGEDDGRAAIVLLL